MSLSVPQNGVKADNEPVIELFVKVSPRLESHGRSFSFRVTNITPVSCDGGRFVSAIRRCNVASELGFFFVV